FDLHQADLDYTSWEISLWPQCEMTWRFGGRLASIYFDSRGTSPAIDGLAGEFDRQVSNWFIGFGPHAGLDLTHTIEGTGLYFIARSDIATLLGKVHQGFSETVAPATPGGAPATATTRVTGTQDVPTVRAQAGLGWRPPAASSLLLFVGYQYEYSWNV